MKEQRSNDERKFRNKDSTKEKKKQGTRKVIEKAGRIGN